MVVFLEVSVGWGIELLKRRGSEKWGATSTAVPLMGPRRPYYNPKCLFFIFLTKSIFRSSYTISSIVLACEIRLTENGISPEPNLCCCKLNILDWSLHSPQSYCTTCKLLKSTPCCICILWSYSSILVILQPLTRITTLRRACFTERRAPSKAWIGGNIRVVVAIVAKVQC